MEFTGMPLSSAAQGNTPTAMLVILQYWGPAEGAHPLTGKTACLGWMNGAGGLGEEGKPRPTGGQGKAPSYWPEQSAGPAVRREHAKTMSCNQRGYELSH